MRTVTIAGKIVGWIEHKNNPKNKIIRQKQKYIGKIW